ncbi:MAG: HAD family hydrolase [Anaerolineales bacterium]|nr:HAD family hydrolase [Anaerolineales bacterium]
MNNSIRAVIFDLGNTLMYGRESWPLVLDQADEALIQSLYSQGVALQLPGFRSRFKDRLSDYYTRRDIDLFETTYLAILRRLLSDEGFPEQPDEVIVNALDAMFAVTQENWLLEEDAVPMLDTLKEKKLRIGMISNAGYNKDVLQLIEKFRITPYFDFILTSAECSYRKPHPSIFEMALVQWNFPPQSIAMVGDTLTADVLGANAIGMLSIWITRRAENQRPARQDIHPDITIQTLAELPAALP